MKGTKFAVMGTKAISSMAKMKGVKAGVMAFYSRGKLVINNHHILPKKVVEGLAKTGLFDDVPEFDIDALYNRIDLPGVGKGVKDAFHTNHRSYSRYVRNLLNESAAANTGGKLTRDNIVDAINQMDKMIGDAYSNYIKTGENLNTYFKNL